MKTLLKVLAAVVGVVIVLFVGAAIAAAVFIDPNEHKDRIVAAVEEQTGRELRIIGDIELSLFPWIGLQLGTVELGNAPGFGEPLFARTEKVDVRVKLLPLLAKRLEMATVTVHGLTLNLEKNAQGRTNWEDLVAGKADSEPSPGGEEEKEGAPAVGALAIGGLDVRDASLSWDDATTGQRVEIANLKLQTSAVTVGEPVDVALALDVALDEPPMTGTVSLDGTLEADPAARRTEISGLAVRGDFQGERLPGGKAELALDADLVHDGARGELEIRDLSLRALDLALSGNLQAAGLGGAPRLEGALRVAEFNPKALLAALGREAPVTADADALTSVSLRADIGGEANRVLIKPLEVKLDDSTLSGEVGIADLKTQALRFDLVLDDIDADRYLPPREDDEKGQTQAAASPGTAAAGAAELPNEALRALDVDGRLKVGKLKVANLNVSNLSAKILAKKGRISLSPVSADLYEGRYEGDLRLDVRAAQPRVSVNERLAGIQAGPLLKDLQGVDRLTGQGDVRVEATAVGATPEAVKKTLNGDATFAFTDGEFKGVNIGRMIRSAKARLEGEKLPPEQEEQKTDFTEMRGTARFADGIATNDDLIVKTPLLRIEGKGRADLLAETVDYVVKSTVVATTEGQGGKELEELKGVPVPIRVTGSFAEPKYALDFAAFSEAVAKTKAADVLEEKAGEVTEKLEEKVGEDAVKGLLKGLLKQ